MGKCLFFSHTQGYSHIIPHVVLGFLPGSAGGDRRRTCVCVCLCSFTIFILSVFLAVSDFTLITGTQAEKVAVPLCFVSVSQRVVVFRFYNITQQLSESNSAARICCASAWGRLPSQEGNDQLGGRAKKETGAQRFFFYCCLFDQIIIDCKTSKWDHQTWSFKQRSFFTHSLWIC